MMYIVTSKVFLIPKFGLKTVQTLIKCPMRNLPVSSLFVKVPVYGVSSQKMVCMMIFCRLLFFLRITFFKNNIFH